MNNFNQLDKSLKSKKPCVFLSIKKLKKFDKDGNGRIVRIS